MTPLQKILALREGGQTQRCHTIPHTGTYNVGIHSYNAVNLLLMLHPSKPSVTLIKAVLWHDIAERWTGDIPAPAKWHSPELKTILDTLESRVLGTLGIGKYLENLTTEEASWLSGVDLLELYIWTFEQREMGNRNVQPMYERILQIFEEKKAKYPKEILKFVQDFTLERLPELHELFEEEDYVIKGK